MNAIGNQTITLKKGDRSMTWTTIDWARTNGTGVAITAPLQGSETIDLKNGLARGRRLAGWSVEHESLERLREIARKERRML